MTKIKKAYLSTVGKNPRHWSEQTQNYYKDIKNMLQYNTERISCYKKLYRMESKEYLEFAQEAYILQIFALK